MKLIDRIDERLQALGLSDRKASMRAVGKPDLIRDIRRGKLVSADRLRELARTLETTVDYLHGTTDISAPRDAIPPRPIPQRQAMPKNLPVYGTALGASAAVIVEGEAIEQTDLYVGEVIDYFRRPPALRDRPDVYALYVQGDSMEPAFESGEGIIADPKKPPMIRDYVIVYLRGSTDQTSAVLIKRLVRRTTEFIELQQYNPPHVFRVEMRKVAGVHRVMRPDEILGV